MNVLRGRRGRPDRFFGRISPAPFLPLGFDVGFEPEDLAEFAFETGLFIFRI